LIVEAGAVFAAGHPFRFRTGFSGKTPKAGF
jgi:hypothetical protein